MVTVVVVINLAIALILLCVAWLVWQIRKQLAKIANALTAYERSAYAALHNAPNKIYKGKLGIDKLRQGNEPLQLQLQRVRQVLSLFFVGWRAWQRFSRRAPFPKKPL